MVEVELWDSCSGDPRARIVYRWLWTLRVDGTAFELRGSVEQFDPQLKIANLYDAPDWLGRVKKSITFADNPEMWARTLNAAYRSGYTIPVVVRDDDPPVNEEAPLEREAVTLLEPELSSQLEALAGAQDAVIFDGSAAADEQALILSPVVAVFSCSELVERARAATADERAAAPVVLSGRTAQLTLGHGTVSDFDWQE